MACGSAPPPLPVGPPLPPSHTASGGSRVSTNSSARPAPSSARPAEPCRVRATASAPPDPPPPRPSLLRPREGTACPSRPPLLQPRDLVVGPPSAVRAGPSTGEKGLGQVVEHVRPVQVDQVLRHHGAEAALVRCGSGGDSAAPQPVLLLGRPGKDC